eukprot:m.192325 g.192325  ORF g.192325 m.192325 type:complete len:645 (-) comp32461_c0_seq1:111-2045(-)
MKSHDLIGFCVVATLMMTAIVVSSASLQPGIHRTPTPTMSPSLRRPPMGFSSWNHFHMGVSAELLLDTADAFTSTGLQSAGYVYINSDDGWLDLNRTVDGQLHPATTFTNGTLKDLADGLHAKGFKFGIYAAAGQTTCGLRAGTLYHELSDAQQFAAAGVDYLKYDDCGEANIQSYQKYFVMKDALAAAYGSRGKTIDYYSYEPFQVYVSDAVPQMTWTSTVGDLWRTGGDIRANWNSVLGNAHANNHWAPNGRPGHYNDADMLEIGNGPLTIAEQRSHFALWCVMKSPLIIGADVRALSADSLAILKNPHLIAINQDALGIQGTLRSVSATPNLENHSQPYQTQGQTREQTQPLSQLQSQARPHHITASRSTQDAGVLPAMAVCGFGAAVVDAQQWQINAGRLTSLDGKKCVARSPDLTNEVVAIVACGSSQTNPLEAWEFGGANITVSQVRDPQNVSACLSFNGTSLHMEHCRLETSDASTPADCATSRCRFSSKTDQLWYLNSLHQFSSAYTNFDGGVPPGANTSRHTPHNTPMCLSAVPSAAPVPPGPPPPRLNTSMPLQVWAGPLMGGDVVVLLLNTGNTTSPITAAWGDIDLKDGVVVVATDLWTGANIGTMSHNTVTANVSSHDVAAIRLTPVTPLH